MKYNTIRHRRHGKNKDNPSTRILQDTGNLRNSLTGPSDAFSIFEINSNSMTIGSKHPYASYHQRGTEDGHVPVRQFFPDPTPKSIQDKMRNAWTNFYYRSLK